MKFISIVKGLVSTKKGKIITLSSAVVVVGIIMVISMVAASNKSLAASMPESTSSLSSASSKIVTFAAASAVSVPDSKSSSSSSSNPLSVNVGASSASKTSSTASKQTTSSTPIKTTASLKDTSVPTATPPTANTSKTSDSYAGYTFLDMTDFNKGSDIYYTDAENSIDARFENRVNQGCNLPRDRMGSTVVDLSSPTLLYAEGEVTLDNLRSVLVNGKKYIGGGSSKYVVTGVYENSGIAYDRSNISKIDSNPNAIINSIYSKGFVNNQYSSTTSYCDGYLCTKVSDGGSAAKTGYVRALVFTLKKIS